MNNEKEYYIKIQGVKVSVSKQVYEEYYKSARRIRYYEHDIKVGRIRKRNGKDELFPSKEDSYDRLSEVGAAPATGFDDVVNEVMAKFSNQQLYDALEELSPDEFNILFELFWNENSERDLSKKTDVPQKTINDRKRRILKKLKMLLQEPE